MKPKIIYKYREWNNSNHRSMISKQKIYLSSATSFNDPYDCTLNISLVDSLVAHNYMDQAITRHYGSTTEKERAQFIEDVKNSEEFNNEEWEDKRIEDFLKDVHTRIGVFSLTEHRDNILMWSHYANNHRGFCIGFDFEKIASDYEVGDTYKVQYTDYVPTILLDELFEMTPNVVMKLVFTKFKKWEYEDEYRCVKPKIKDRHLTLPKDYFKEVIIGCLMPEEDEKKLIQSVKANLPDVQIFKARKERKHYRIKILPI